MKHPVIGLLALSWTCGCAPAATPCEPVDGASGPGLFSGETHDFQVGPLKPAAPPLMRPLVAPLGSVLQTLTMMMGTSSWSRN